MGGVTSDPVSWLMIERGWAVVGSDGADQGEVVEVFGEPEAGIFNGLAIGRFGGGDRYVPARAVGVIREGLVELRVDEAGLHALPEAERPGPA